MGEAGKRTPKVNKACVRCRARKVKCDADVVGLPCSSCKSRQCAEDCVQLIRKGQTRKRIHVSSTPGQAVSSPAISRRYQSESGPPSNSPHCQSPGQTEPDLLYLHILNDTVEDTPGSSQLRTTFTTPRSPKLWESLTPRNCLSTTLSQIDETDRDYLAKKGVFELPHSQHLDTLVKTYFDHVYPFAPVINRADFLRRYQSGDYSLLLLRVMLTTASLHAPISILLACGFASRLAAQESFFSRARLLYDFAHKDDPLLLLQASIALSNVILDHPTDRDFGYWFQNAIRLANKLNLRTLAFESTKPREVLKLYRRIWWTLYSIDVFSVFINPRRSCLLEKSQDVKPAAEDYWEDEHVSGGSSGLFSDITPQQKALPVALCEMSLIFEDCLSIVRSQPQLDPRQVMHSLDSWRASLASKMHIGHYIGTDVYYLYVKALSYRYECALCRLMRRSSQRVEYEDWREWIKQRFRSAVLELDSIAMRVLASGTIEKFPIAFVTTIAMLLALHIESALDSTETQLIRSMCRMSINQTMPVLTQGREIPALKRALPIFEEILTRNNLYLIPSDSLGPSNRAVPSQPPSQDKNMADARGSPHSNRPSPQLEQWESIPSLGIDFLGFDFSDQWQQNGQLDFPGWN